ncbi:MAG: hypothetical protein KF724_06100 [Phycisphaeraceae bacterium]|nr:hypothetical protein [Phycisphaeraceae bacterium]
MKAAEWQRRASALRSWDRVLSDTARRLELLEPINFDGLRLCLRQLAEVAWEVVRTRGAAPDLLRLVRGLVKFGHGAPSILPHLASAMSFDSRPIGEQVAAWAEHARDEVRGIERGTDAERAARDAARIREHARLAAYLAERADTMAEGHRRGRHDVVTAPRLRPRMGKAEAEKRAAYLLRADPEFRRRTCRAWADAIGCAEGMVSQLRAWRDLGPRGASRRRAEPQRATVLRSLTDGAAEREDATDWRAVASERLPGDPPKGLASLVKRK